MLRGLKSWICGCKEVFAHGFFSQNYLSFSCQNNKPRRVPISGAAHSCCLCHLPAAPPWVTSSSLSRPSPCPPTLPRGPQLMFSPLPQRGCHCPQAPAKALRLAALLRLGCPPCLWEQCSRPRTANINILLQKIRAKHGPHRTSPMLRKSALGVYSIFAVAAGLSIWAWMSGPAGGSRRGLRIEKATYF